MPKRHTNSTTKSHKRIDWRIYPKTHDKKSETIKFAVQIRLFVRCDCDIRSYWNCSAAFLSTSLTRRVNRCPREDRGIFCCCLAGIALKRSVLSSFTTETGCAGAVNEFEQTELMGLTSALSDDSDWAAITMTSTSAFYVAWMWVCIHVSTCRRAVGTRCVCSVWTDSEVVLAWQKYFSIASSNGACIPVQQEK